MRFDDTLETVLAADLSTPVGVQSLWRQLVDLIGRRRVAADSRALSMLAHIRDRVPAPVRAASARGLEFATPPTALVRFLAGDEIAVAAPVLRNARLSTTDWVALLPELSPAARAVLRHRRDLSPTVRRALESFGSVDFVLPDHVIRAEQPEAQVSLAEEPDGPVAPEIAEALVAWDDVIAAEAPAYAEPELEPVAEALVGEPAHDAEPEALVDWTEVVAARPAPPVAPAPVLQPLGALIARLEAAAAAPMAAEAPGIDATAQVEGEAIAEPSRGGVDMVEAAVEAEPELMAEAEPEITAEAEPEIMAEAEPETAAQAEPEMPIEAEPLAVAPEVEPDMSFVELAELAPAVPMASEKVNLAESLPVQSGTDESLVPEAAIEPPVEAAQATDMSGDIEMLEAPVLDAPEPSTELAAAVAAALEEIDAAEAAEHGTADIADLGEGGFQISEVVARIDAFWRQQEEHVREARPIARAEGFRFETDSKGVIRWVDGVSRAPVVGLSLDLTGVAGASSVDGIAAGAFRRRAGFSSARMVIDGESDAAGDWLISGIPVFDPANGRFTGYRGTARRPRSDERADPIRTQPTPAADSLRQLVHELRTPTNAIAGFAEMIESEMLGPVPGAYRDRAQVIRGQARDLLGAIDDLDLAARIESDALSLVPGPVQLRPVLSDIADDLAQLSALRGSWLALPVDDLAVVGDRRAVERLLARLMATLVSASGQGERIGVRTALDGDEMVAVTLDRPAALADYPGDAVLGIDDEGGDATLLGTGFALRLARNLARELGGSLVIEPETLTLRLPAHVNRALEQAI